MPVARHPPHRSVHDGSPSYGSYLEYLTSKRSHGRGCWAWTFGIQWLLMRENLFQFNLLPFWLRRHRACFQALMTSSRKAWTASIITQHRKIVLVSNDYWSEPTSHLRNRIMHSFSDLTPDITTLCCQSLSHCLAQYDKIAFSAHTATQDPILRNHPHQKRDLREAYASIGYSGSCLNL